MNRMDPRDLDAMDAALGELWRGDGRPLERLFGGSGTLFGDLTILLDTIELPAGTTIGAYTIVRRIDAGGMGIVYEAEQADPRRRVALKLARADRLDERARHRFEVEKEVLGRLQHPAIARILEGGVVSGPREDVPYLVLEWVEGMPLTRYAAAHALSTPERVGLVADVAAAIAHAHRRNVLHRDLKPSNVLVTESGRPIVLDFGVARLLEGAERSTVRTDTGDLVGTILYMSPEQLRGDPSVDFRSDVYALGVLLFELLSGRLPFEGGGAPLPEVVRRIHERPAPRLRDVADRPIPPDLEAIVGKCLAEDRVDRYESSAALEADLRRHLRGERVTARRPSAFELLRRAARRHRALATAISLAFVSLVGGIVVSTRFALQRDREAKAAVSTRTFLERMIASVDLAAGGSRDVTLREVLDRERPRIGDAFADEPALEAYLRNLVGKALATLGESAAAAEELELALARLPPGSSPEVLCAALSNLAHARLDVGSIDEALRLTREAVEIGGAAFGPEHPNLRSLRASHGVALLQAGRAREADAVLSSALDLHASLGPEGRLDGTESDPTPFTFRPAVCLSALAMATSELGRNEDAERMLKVVLDDLMERRGPDHSDTIDVRVSRVSVLHQLGSHRTGLPAAEGVAETALAVLGPQHSTTQRALVLLARAYYQQARHDEAEAALRRVLESPVRAPQVELQARGLLAQLAGDRGEIVESLREQRAVVDEAAALLGADHPDLALYSADLATAMAAVGEYDGAEKLFRRAAADLERIFDRLHPSTLDVRTNLAVLRAKQGHAQEAMDDLRTLLEEIRDRREPSQPRVLHVETCLATVEEYFDRLSDPVGTWERLSARSARLHGPTHPETSYARGMLADALESADRLAEAERLRRELIDLHVELHGERHPAVHRLRAALAETLRLAGRLDEADAQSREAVEGLESALGSDHPDVLAIRVDRSVLLGDLGHVDRQVALLRRCVADLGRRLGPDHPQTVTARSNLGVALGQAGKIAEARSQMESCLSEKERVFGREHDHTLSTLNNLAHLDNENGRIPHALERFDDLVGRMAARHGSAHTKTLTVRHNRALSLLALGRVEEAATECGAVTARRTEILGVDHRDTLRSRQFHAHALRRLGELDAALAEIELAVDVATCRFGPSDARTAASLAELVACLVASDRLGDVAEPLARLTAGLIETEQVDAYAGEVRRSVPAGWVDLLWWNALLGAIHVHGPTDPRTVRAAFELGRTTLRTMPREARSLLEEVVLDWSEAPGPDAPRTLEAMNLLGVAALESGDRRVAEACFRAAADGRETTYGPDHPTTRQSRANLAVVLMEAGRPAEAEPTLRAAVEWARENLPAGSNSRLVDELNLALVLGDLGRHDEARDVLAAGRELARSRPVTDPYRISVERAWADVLRDAGDLEGS
ncbi:MAG: tetratricopeptide repeat protein, partial [Planctomycetota bacterium JB042]